MKILKYWWTVPYAALLIFILFLGSRSSYYYATSITPNETIKQPIVTNPATNTFILSNHDNNVPVNPFNGYQVKTLLTLLMMAAGSVTASFLIICAYYYVKDKKAKS